MNHLRIVFQIPKEKQIFHKFSKCEFWLMSVAFVRRIVTSECVEVDPKEMDTFKSSKIPLSPTTIQSFLGLFGYNRRFV